MPRILLAAVIVAGASLLETTASRAQTEGPWCATVTTGEGSVREICHFRDLASCQAEVISGNRGQCGPNPRYHASQTTPRAAKRKRHE